ncbi:MAG: C2H2-type zinc finger protein [Clostridiales bacterium]|nr:C2H2-type zinc finger protein [Clostridiales bacterium]
MKKLFKQFLIITLCFMMVFGTVAVGNSSKGKSNDLFLLKASAADIYTCKICGKIFTSTEDYNDHLETHFIVIMGSLAACSQCGIIVKKEDYNSHINSHSVGVTPTNHSTYTCSKCGKIFTSTDDYNDHLETHIINIYRDSKLIFTADGEIVCSVVSPCYGFDEPAVPEKAGYTGEWESYKLGTSDTVVNAIYTPIIYKVTFMANGIIVKESSFSVFNTNISEPPIPEKIGYIGEWESYSIEPNDIVIKAVYTKISAPQIKNYVSAMKVDYKSTLKFSATVDLPAGYSIGWSTGDTGPSTTLKQVKDSEIDVYCYLIKNGQKVDGSESEVETVIVNTGFFAKLSAFFRSLFGTLPRYVDNKKQ